MKLTPRFLPLLTAFGAFLTLSAVAPVARAAETPGAKVTGLLGLAQHAKAGGAYLPVKVGSTIEPGDVIQTANGSALDLDFGKGIGTVRLTQSTTLAVTAHTATDVQLDLRGGEALGRLKKLANSSRFEIKVPGGIVGVMEGDFRLDSRGYLVLVDGTAIFVEMRGEAEPVAHTLKAGKAVYYTPVDHTIRPAPRELEREVKSQLKARLPKK